MSEYVCKRVHDRMWDSIRNPIWFRIWDPISRSETRWDRVRDRVWTRVWESVGDRVWDPVRYRIFWDRS